MSLEVVRQIVDKFLNYDYSVLSDDVKGEVFGLGVTAVGAKEIEAAVNRIYHEMFEGEPVVRSVFVDEGGGTLEFDLIGIHKGEVLGVPPTGRKVSVPCVAIYEISNEEITAIRMYFPSSVLLDQIQDIE